jgi:hypothetical protein
MPNAKIVILVQENRCKFKDDCISRKDSLVHGQGLAEELDELR